MTQVRMSKILPPTAAVLAFGALSLASAMAAEQVASPAVQRRYQQESAQCMKLGVDGRRADCLSEASTRRASTLPSAADEDPGRLSRNALKRCEPLAEPDRSDCVARTRGQGTTTGSVAAGGIYRELVTREVLPAATAASAPK